MDFDYSGDDQLQGKLNKYALKNMLVMLCQQ